MYSVGPLYMDVSKNRGKPPKWMVYSGTPYFLMDDLGVPLFLETPIRIYIYILMESRLLVYRYSVGPDGLEFQPIIYLVLVHYIGSMVHFLRL